MNESLNIENYGYIGNNENVVNCSTMNYNPPSVHYQTLVQAPPFNSAGTMANAASHGCTVIIVKADINLERLMSIIRLFARVERLYGCSSFFIYQIFWY